MGTPIVTLKNEGGTAVQIPRDWAGGAAFQRGLSGMALLPSISLLLQGIYSQPSARNCGQCRSTTRVCAAAYLFPFKYVRSEPINVSAPAAKRT
jgi:hypothetical protein